MEATRYTITLDRKEISPVSVKEEDCDAKIDDTPFIKALANGFKEWMAEQGTKGVSA